MFRRGPSPLVRTPSPRRRAPYYNHNHGVPPHQGVYHQGVHHDIGFSDTVSNVVEIVKHDHHRPSTRYQPSSHYRVPGGK